MRTTPETLNVDRRAGHKTKTTDYTPRHATTSGYSQQLENRLRFLDQEERRIKTWERENPNFGSAIVYNVAVGQTEIVWGNFDTDDNDGHVWGITTVDNRWFPFRLIRKRLS